jgi:DNA-binding MarR family transcriptional regulator
MRNTSQRSAKRAAAASSSVKSVQAEPEAAVMYLLKQLSHAMRQALDEALRREKLGLSFAYLAVLNVLEKEPGVPGAELARRASITAQTMNSILRRLEEEGTIERQPHPANARSDSWYVTELGHKRLARGKLVGERICRRMLSPLSATEMRQFQNFLTRCIRAMELPEGAAAVSPRRRASGQRSRH